MSDVADKYGSLPQATRDKIQAQVKDWQAGPVSSPGETVKAMEAVGGSYGDDNASGPAKAKMPESGKAMSPDVAQGVEKTTDTGPMGRPARDYAAAHTAEPAKAEPAKQDVASKYGAKPVSPEAGLSPGEEKKAADLMAGTGVKAEGAGKSVAEKYGPPPPKQDHSKAIEKDGPSK